jgi:hypothetical protein
VLEILRQAHLQVPAQLLCYVLGPLSMLRLPGFHFEKLHESVHDYPKVKVAALSHVVALVQVAYMEMLKSRGLELYAAYGNTITDIRAYAAAGIPKVLAPFFPQSPLSHTVHGMQSNPSLLCPIHSFLLCLSYV